MNKLKKLAYPIISGLVDKPESKRCLGFNTKAMNASWGGANQFALQMASHVAKKGYEISYDLERKLSHSFILDVRKIETCQYSVKQLVAAKKKNQRLKIVHRINDCDIRKSYTKQESNEGYDRVDQMVLDANEEVDFTVFISKWLRDYYVEKGFDLKKEHVVITNAADPEIFYPDLEKQTSTEFKIVTHHWSDNWMKGFHEYVELDNLIAEGKLKNCSLTIVGRWPKEIEWKAAKTIGPKHGPELAEILRQHDLYITASRWEPGGMHFIEGMQCGLPVIYHQDGGGIVEIACKGGVVIGDDLLGAVEQATSQYKQLREDCIANMPNGKRMCRQYEEYLGL